MFLKEIKKKSFLKRKTETVFDGEKKITVITITNEKLIIIIVSRAVVIFSRRCE